MEIKRNIESDLLTWARKSGFKPLILRGARQTGKSYLIQKILARQFEQVIQLNLEQEKKYHVCFSRDLRAKTIIKQLEAIGGFRIIPGRTLLFIDEIQECHGAIRALRYFFEELPELHVAAAGSLLEFAFGAIPLPVGRVTLRYLGPLTFEEYLQAVGKEALRDLIRNHSFDKAFPEALHQEALREVQTYMALGGMPEVVKHFAMTRDYLDSEGIQNDIIALFRNDFPKYAKKQKELEYIGRVFEKTVPLIAKQLMYVKIARDIRHEYIKKCLKLLEMARLFHMVRPTSGEPLAINAREQPLKPIFLDIGLMQRLQELPISRWLKNGGTLLNTGQLAEQFVGQIMISNNIRSEEHLYYWNRNKRGSSAEVDYLIQTADGIFPLEVKSGAEGRLRSLRLLLETFPEIHCGFRVSSNNFKQVNNIRTIPLYAFEHWLNTLKNSR